MKLDKTDLRILKILQNNSNLTTKELAARVNLSATPVFERVKKLEKQGYIKNYADLTKLLPNILGKKLPTSLKNFFNSEFSFSKLL